MISVVRVAHDYRTGTSGKV